MVPVFARPRRPGFRLGGRNDESGRVKCARSGAMHAGTAKHRLRFLGFARNDMRALQGNDKGSEEGGLPDRVWSGACAWLVFDGGGGLWFCPCAISRRGSRALGGERRRRRPGALAVRYGGSASTEPGELASGSDAGHVQQITPGVRLGHRRHVLRRPLGHQLAAAVSRQRPEVDQPIGVLDQIEVVLDQYDGIAGVHKPMQHVHELRAVVERKPGSRLIEYVERAARRPFRQFGRQLDSLGLAAAQRRCRLAEPDVAEADVDQRIQLVANAGDVLEQARGLGLPSCSGRPLSTPP